MISVERSFTVHQPIGDVFAYLSDFTTTEQWDPGTVTTTRIDDGPLMVGSRFRNVSSFMGRKTELEYELRTLRPNAQLVFIGKNKSVTATDDIRFRAIGDSTEVTYSSQIVLHGLIKVTGPVVQRAFDKLADKTIEQMKRVLSGPAIRRSA